MDGSAPSASDQGVLALEDWKQPPRHQPGPAAAPVLAVDGFEGAARLAARPCAHSAHRPGPAVHRRPSGGVCGGVRGLRWRPRTCGPRCWVWLEAKPVLTAVAALERLRELHPPPVHRGSPARGAAIYEGAAANDGSGGSAGTIAPANGLGVRRHGGLGNQTWAEGDMKSPGNIPS